MGTKIKFALLSMTVASGVGLYGCSGGTQVVTAPGGTGGSTGDGTGGSNAGTGGNSSSGTGGSKAGSGGSGSGSGGMLETGTGGSSAETGGTTGAGTGGSESGTGGVAQTGTGGRSSTGGATGSGGATASGGGTGTGGGTATGTGGAPTGPINVLIWNNALAYGHAARIDAIPDLKAREATDNIKFDTTYAHTTHLQEGTSDTTFDASVFTDSGLDKYDVVFFLDTTGNTIDDSMKTVRRQALQDFIEKKGRGFVGTHSATDTYQGSAWPWYVDFIGANFSNHSNAGTSGTAKYFDQTKVHPILMAGATPNPWNRSEEWYTLTRDPLSSKIAGIEILLTCHDVSMTQERDSAWVHNMPVAAGGTRGGGLFYSAFGHSESAFKEKAVMDMIIAAIKWTAYRL